ncbi:MAG: His/Gly/Thr/Pro-type tRNA ligase C-terminal domain-containing protein, partial [Candidatus Hydrothermarchaeaceae archaeon]
AIMFLVVPIGEEMIKDAIKISTKLRKTFRCEVDLLRRKLKNALSHANTNKIPYVVIVGEDELKRGHVLIKDMKTAEQNEVNIESLGQYIKKILNFT